MAAIILPDNDSGEHTKKGPQHPDKEIPEVTTVPRNPTEEVHLDLLGTTAADAVESPM